MGIFLPHRPFSDFLDTSWVSWNSVDFWPCGPHLSTTQLETLGRHLCFWLVSYKVVPTAPSGGSVICSSSSQSSGSNWLITSPVHYRSIKDGDVHRARSGRALNTGSCAHGVWRAPPFLFVDAPRPAAVGIFTQASLRGHGWLNNCPEVGGWGWKFPANHSLVPLATSLKQWLSRGFPGTLLI